MRMRKFRVFIGGTQIGEYNGTAWSTDPQGGLTIWRRLEATYETEPIATFAAGNWSRIETVDAENA